MKTEKQGGLKGSELLLCGLLASALHTLKQAGIKTVQEPKTREEQEQAMGMVQLLAHYTYEHKSMEGFVVEDLGIERIEALKKEAMQRIEELLEERALQDTAGNA